MKTYRSEEEFVTMFAKHVNEGEKQFEVNGKTFSVDGKYQNSSKAAVYNVTVNGTTKGWTIMQLKKYLGVEYKKEYNRTGESAKKANTAVVIKTDEELMKTAEAVEERCKKAVEVLVKYANEYCYDINMFIAGGYQDGDEWITTKEAVFNDLKKNRDIALAERAAQEEKAAKEKAAKVETVTELTTELQKALAAGNLALVAELSAKMAKAAK